VDPNTAACFAGASTVSQHGTDNTKRSRSDQQVSTFVWKVDCHDRHNSAMSKLDHAAKASRCDPTGYAPLPAGKPRALHKRLSIIGMASSLFASQPANRTATKEEIFFV
jgi:hypothetical protein